MCKSVPNTDCANKLLCAFLRSRFLPFGLPRCAFGFLFCGLLLPEPCELPLVLGFELLRFPHVLILWAFEPLQLKRVHRSSRDFLIQKKIGAEPAAFALNLWLLFGFILLFGFSLGCFVQLPLCIELRLKQRRFFQRGRTALCRKLSANADRFKRIYPSAEPQFNKIAANYFCPAGDMPQLRLLPPQICSQFLQ